MLQQDLIELELLSSSLPWIGVFAYLTGEQLANKTLGFLSHHTLCNAGLAARRAKGYSSQACVLLRALEKSSIDNTETRKRFTCFHNISVKLCRHNISDWKWRGIVSSECMKKIPLQGKRFLKTLLWKAFHRFVTAITLSKLRNKRGSGISLFHLKLTMYPN